MAAEQATTTEDFAQSLGLNTHLDFGGAYANLSVVEAAIQYLGIDNLRDSPGNPGDVSLWQQVAQATGASFDAYIGETSPSGMYSELSTMQQIAQTGILNYMEGGNEEDDAYPASLGNDLPTTAAFQQQLFAAAQAAGLPAINMSFGAGWTAANNWAGDYGNVGDLSAFTDYANGHTYPQGAPESSIQLINSDSHLAAGSRPVITTEFGYDTGSTDATQAAKWTLDATLDAMNDGDVKLYFYALFDDQSGAFGLMNPDGSPKPAGTALHNLTSLLADNGGSFVPGTLNYTIGNTTAGDNSLLMEKSDGSYWLALWNEANGAHTVTVNLASPAGEVDVFDPLTGTSAVQTVSDTSSVQIDVPDHPVLVEIIPSGGQAPQQTSASTSPTSSSTGSDTNSTTAGDPSATFASKSASAPEANQTPPPSDNAINIATDDPTPVELVNSTIIIGSSGDHMIFIGGTGDTLTATGGTESVQAYQGDNSITTGSGNDTIRFAGSSNTIDAGGGDNQLMDSGSNNTIVLPGANEGTDYILGWVTQNGDMFDLRPALAQTGWNGDPSTIAGYVQVSMAGNNAVIGIDPNGASAGTPVATLNGTGQMDLSSLLTHAITA